MKCVPILLTLVFLCFNAQSAEKYKYQLLAEYPDVQLTVLDVKASTRSFLEIPVWKISYKIEGKNITGVNHKLKEMTTQKCEQVKKDIKKGHVYSVVVKKFNRTYYGETIVEYHIHPKQLGVTCFYSWDNL